MPTMPNVVGQYLTEAQGSLQSAGVLNPSALGYFGTWPIKVTWKIPANSKAGAVTAQSPASGGTVAVNSTVTLTVAEFPIAAVYP